jgi:hypothetical protein
MPVIAAAALAAGPDRLQSSDPVRVALREAEGVYPIDLEIFNRLAISALLTSSANRRRISSSSTRLCRPL